MGSDLGMPTVPSVTIDRLSSKKVPFLKFPIAFPTSISGGKIRCLLRRVKTWFLFILFYFFISIFLYLVKR